MEHICSIKIGGTKWNKPFIHNIPFPFFLTTAYGHHRPPSPPPPPATTSGHRHHLRPPSPPPDTTTSGHHHRHRPLLPPSGTATGHLRPPPATATTFGHRHRPSATSGNVGVNWSFNQSCSVSSSLVMSYQMLNNCPVLFCHVLFCPVMSCPILSRYQTHPQGIVQNRHYDFA